jgi:pyruvate/2-oxoglutarate dehydrogenase complex dihydrolipoamide acyltransferase (E2) component
MSESELHELDYPSSRQLTFDVGKIGLGKHHVKAFLEVDVSDAWRILRENRSSDKKISFFAWLIKVTADCVAQNPQAAGVNLIKKNKVAYFDDVDISIVLEKEIKGMKVPLPYVVRKANEKNLEQIQAEIDAVKNQSTEDESDYVLGKESNQSWMKLFTHLPQGIRLWIMRSFVLNKPLQMKNTMGNVMITTVGLVGHTHGWIVPYSIHSLCLAFGSINGQPLIRKGEIVIGKVLHLAVLIDHDVIDGAPAGAFVDNLVMKMEKGHGLEDIKG